MTPEYRSVTVTGIIKNIYMANSINYLELLVKEGGQNISITFEVGANNKLIGYNSPQLRDSTIRNLWRRIKVSSLKDSVKEGDNIKIETMTWMQSDSLCGDVQSCRDNFTIFKKYEKANSRIDKFLFDKANSEFTNPEPLLRSTEILGPVITISHII